MPEEKLPSEMKPTHIPVRGGEDNDLLPPYGNIRADLLGPDGKPKQNPSQETQDTESSADAAA